MIELCSTIKLSLILLFVFSLLSLEDQHLVLRIYLTVCYHSSIKKALRPVLLYFALIAQGTAWEEDSNLQMSPSNNQRKILIHQKIRISFMKASLYLFFQALMILAATKSLVKKKKSRVFLQKGQKKQLNRTSFIRYEYFLIY